MPVVITYILLHGFFLPEIPPYLPSTIHICPLNLDKYGEIRPKCGIKYDICNYVAQRNEYLQMHIYLFFPAFTLGLYLHNVSESVSQSVSQSVHQHFLSTHYSPQFSS